MSEKFKTSQISATVRNSIIGRVNKLVEGYNVKTSFSSMVDMLLETGLDTYEHNMAKLNNKKKPFNHSKK